MTPILAKEDTLLMFLGHLAQQGLAYQTIKVYLSAVRNLHVSAGLHNKFAEQLTPRLETVLKGIKKDKAAANPRTRLPVTFKIMENLRGTFNKKPTDHNNIMTNYTIPIQHYKPQTTYDIHCSAHALACYILSLSSINCITR